MCRMAPQSFVRDRFWNALAQSVRCGANAGMGTRDTSASFGIQSVHTLTMLGVAYFGAIRMACPVAFVWLSLLVDWLVSLTISYGWMKSGMWKRLEVS